MPKNPKEKKTGTPSLFFKRTSHKEKINNIVEMTIESLRKQHFKSLKNGLRKSLGGQFAEEHAEEAFQKFVAKAIEKGIIESIIKDYLQESKNEIRAGRYSKK